jgi:hypothetical protein
MPKPLSTRERRQGERPSGVLLGRICAVIDLLVEAGMSEQSAARAMARRMISAGVSAPAGRSRTGWQRLLEWRAAHLVGESATDEVFEAFEGFKELLNALPADGRLERVLDESFWDRRRHSNL